MEETYRSVRFVTDWRKKQYNQYFANCSNAAPKLKSPQASQDIIVKASGQQGKGCSVAVKETAEKPKEHVVPRAINNCHPQEDQKPPFHETPKSPKIEAHISDRLWMCD